MENKPKDLLDLLPGGRKKAKERLTALAQALSQALGMSVTFQGQNGDPLTDGRVSFSKVCAKWVWGEGGFPGNTEKQDECKEDDRKQAGRAIAAARAPEGRPHTIYPCPVGFRCIVSPIPVTLREDVAVDPCCLYLGQGITTEDDKEGIRSKIATKLGAPPGHRDHEAIISELDVITPQSQEELTQKADVASEIANFISEFAYSAYLRDFQVRSLCEILNACNSLDVLLNEIGFTGVHSRAQDGDYRALSDDVRGIRKQRDELIDTVAGSPDEPFQRINQSKDQITKAIEDAKQKAGEWIWKRLQPQLNDNLRSLFRFVFRQRYKQLRERLNDAEKCAARNHFADAARLAKAAQTEFESTPPVALLLAILFAVCIALAWLANVSGGIGSLRVLWNWFAGIVHK